MMSEIEKKEGYAEDNARDVRVRIPSGLPMHVYPLASQRFLATALIMGRKPIVNPLFFRRTVMKL
jgi:hypothetical protein